MHISYSRAQAYLSCPYKHYLGYVKGVEKTGVIRPLQFGTDFHKLLELRGDPKKLDEAKIAIGDTYYSLPSKFQTELGEDYLEALSVIFQDYCELYKDEPIPQKTEREFMIKLGTCKGEPIWFKGIIDELYLTKSKGKKHIKIGEHKTFNRRPDMNTLMMNSQKSLYSYAVLKLYGILPEEVIWDYIHSTPASEPIWLENSHRFSTAKNTRITPFSFRRSCQSKGITDPKVLQQASVYEENVSNFFFRVHQPVIPQMVNNVYESFLYTAKQIALQGHKNKTKNLTRECAYCDFQPLCHAELTGANVDEFFEKEEFKIEPREDLETWEKEDYC